MVRENMIYTIRENKQYSRYKKALQIVYTLFSKFIIFGSYWFGKCRHKRYILDKTKRGYFQHPLYCFCQFESRQFLYISRFFKNSLHFTKPFCIVDIASSVLFQCGQLTGGGSKFVLFRYHKKHKNKFTYMRTSEKRFEKLERFFLSGRIFLFNQY